MSLTAKQRIFVEEYLRTWNATAAATVAGYAFPNVEGPKNLVKPSIAVEVRRRIEEHAMSADEVLLRTADIARGDLSAWIDDDGAIDLPAIRASGKGHLLKRYKTIRRVMKTKGGDEHETTTTEIELYPADAAHDRLMRVHGLYNDRVRVTTWQDEVIDLLRRGELTTADVEAAYPDLAGEFFARAGVTVDVDSADA